MALPTHSSNNEKRFIPLEIALLMKTMHIPGVIKLVEHFELPDCHKIIMERFGTPSTCRDLFDFISYFGPLNENIAKFIFQQIVDTVVQVHALGIVHRDIKDENILIDMRTLKVKLIDFGSGAILHDNIYSDFDGRLVQI